jgi:hypothetical protein
LILFPPAAKVLHLHESHKLIGGILVVKIEEEFFRGWLRADQNQFGKSDRAVVLRTRFAFFVWHVSAIYPDTLSERTAREHPICLKLIIFFDPALISARMATGSFRLAAVRRCVWNSINQALFGFGEEV